MEKIAKTAAELESIVNERLKAEPICPDGFTVKVRSTETGWAIDCVPPSGCIAWADCCYRATAIAAELRQSYSLASI
jgi:hypothetical protein